MYLLGVRLDIMDTMENLGKGSLKMFGHFVEVFERIRR